MSRSRYTLLINSLIKNRDNFRVQNMHIRSFLHHRSSCFSMSTFRYVEVYMCIRLTACKIGSRTKMRYKESFNKFAGLLFFQIIHIFYHLLEVQRFDYSEKFQTYLNNVLVCQRLMRFIVLCILEEHLVHVRAGVLIQLVARAEDDQGDLTVTQHGQLVGFLHNSEFSLVECHLSA